MLRFYVATISRLSGCFQHMQTADVHEDDDDTDEEDIKTNLFKAAEQEVKYFPGKKYRSFRQLITEFSIASDNDSLW